MARSEALHRSFHQHGGGRMERTPIVARCEALHHPCHHHGGGRIEDEAGRQTAVCAAQSAHPLHYCVTGAEAKRIVASFFARV